MFIFLVNILALLLFIYLLISYVYFFYIIYCASKERLVNIENKISAIDYQNIFNVVVYANNDEKTISALINALKAQEYNKERYSINVILDNCTDETAKMLEISSGTRLWRLNSEDGIKKGKAEAIRWFFDRIFINDQSDSFVFLNADCTIRPDFLSRLNEKINKTPVISGITLNKNLYYSFTSRAIGYRKIFLNTITFTGRNIAGLLNYLNEDVFALKKDVLLQLRNYFTEGIDFAFELPVLLANQNIKMEHTSDIRVFKQYYETTDNVLEFFNKITFAKFNILKKYYKNLISQDFSLQSKEYILSALYPGEFFIIIGCIFLLKFAFVQGYLLGFNLPYLLTFSFAALFLYLLKIARFNFQKFIFWGCWVLFSPLALLAHYLIGCYNSYNEQKNEVCSQNKNDSSFVNVNVTNGDLEITAQLEILNEDTLYRVVFHYGEHFMSSHSYLRLAEAIQEITDNLMEKGFALKICQNCGYFEFAATGRVDLDRGNCYLKMIKKESKFPEQTCVWDACENIIPAHAKDFVKKELDNLYPQND